MATSLEVRRFRNDEADQLRQVRLASLRDTPEAFGSSFADETAKPPEFWRNWLAGTPSFGAFGGDGAAVGLAIFYRSPLAHICHRGNLNAMYVAPAQRGTGVAADLVHAVLDHARGLVEQVHLSATVGNDRAIRFYRRMGFVEYGREPRGLRCAGRYYDVLLMVRSLARSE